ncbi:formimidoylglutamate deiminase [Microbacterium marinilacus]|uniref:Formimidoylglutamate deiminase n=1 Tax=Microbacterium marinilacus TaxID=415209 RepID=A0ABP7BUS8_9MICO|nr:formimidoylglutamate deiminase [Microbacterium marinilacus]MBY0689121.1 formimidoylglutamate deiminase [Microbacterium marinilacus]
MSVWIDRLLRDGRVERGVLLEADATGTVVTETAGAPRPHGALALDLAVPGLGDAHSHAFHRALRGRTHESGSFWTWRQAMYRAAGRLDPDLYRAFATAVFSEMVASGWTAVGEFHYVHHRPDGTPYPDHDMELAVADAADAAGIRLVLLDTCYLAGGIGRPLAPEQARFGDGDAARWLDRWHALREALEGRSPLVTLGAAIHSVRAVPREAIHRIAGELPDDVPLHVHLSEQPAENEESLAAHGMTPTAVLAAEGALSDRLSVVHATHLTAQDIRLLGGARAHAVFCPTTEADLGDGIGPATELADAGVRLAVGSDQNAVVDPLLELRGLEAGERLRSLRRGRLAPEALWRIGSEGGYGALGLAAPGRVGGPLDLIELDDRSPRTAGSLPEQTVLTATAADVRRTVVGGSVRVVRPEDNAAALADAIHRIFEEEAA